MVSSILVTLPRCDSHFERSNISLNEFENDRTIEWYLPGTDIKFETSQNCDLVKAFMVTDRSDSE